MTANLPPRMHLKHGAYYYVERNKWRRLGKDLAASLREYARIISSGSGGLDDLLDGTLQIAAETVKPATLKQYRAAGHVIKAAFAEFSPDQVTGPVIAQFLDAHRKTPNMANRMRSVLKIAFDRAVLLGLAQANPVTSIPRFKEKKRTRYITPGEFAAIRSKALPLLAVAMELCYLTGQRIGDIIKIRMADIDDQGIYIEQEKTGARLRVRMTAELGEVIAKAKTLSPVRGLMLLHRGDGRKVSYYTVRDQWDKACAAAGVENAHLHDLRAAAGTDADEAGQDSKALLGHKSEASHARYLRGMKVPTVEPVKRRKS